MDDYALVLNAGSSSLKFCVYRRPSAAKWRLEGRGQIEGIGTSPRLTAKDAEGGTLIDQRLGAMASDGRKALGALSDWLRAQYGGARVGCASCLCGTRPRRKTSVACTPPKGF